MRTLEVWTGTQWSEVKLREDGQPVYVSNGALVGPGMRITRVSEENTAPEVVLNKIDLDLGSV